MPESEANRLVFSREEAEAMVSRDAIDYYVKTYRVDRNEARKRLGTQLIAPNLQWPLKKELGDELSGLWFDNDSGNWVVQMTDEASSGAAKEVLERLGLGDSSRLDRVDYTRSEMLEAKSELRVRLLGMLGDKFEGGHLGLGAEAIEVKLPNDLDPEVRGQIAAAVGDVSQGPGRPPVEVAYLNPESLVVEPSACSHPRCDTMAAGVRVGCTAAFKGYMEPGPGRISPGTNWFSAGHCLIYPGGSIGDPWSYEPLHGDLTQYGTVTAAYWGNGFGDAALYHRSSGPLGIPGSGVPGYVNWTTNSIRPIQGWKSQSAAVGTVACKHGAVTGTGCGTVTDNDWDGAIHGETFTDMIRVDGHCVRRGDSGAPITAGDVAVGILSGTDYECPGFSINEPIHRPVNIWNNVPIVLP